MADHNLFFGGLGTSNGDFEMFPQVEPASDSRLVEGAAHKTPVTYAASRHIKFQEPTSALGGETGPQSSHALYAYHRKNNFVAGDVINAVILPMRTRLIDLRWEVHEGFALAGLDFDIQVRNGGTPITLAAGVDGSVAAHGILDVETPFGAAGASTYLQENDMLQIVLNTVPADGLWGLYLQVDPIMREYSRGAY